MLPRALVLENHRRFTHHGDVRAAAEALIPKLRAELFPEQLAVVDDHSPLQAVRCPRRAGKTRLSGNLLVIDSVEKGELNQFWAVTHNRAKELVWDELTRIIRKHNIDPRVNESELSIRWPWSDRAITRLKGANTAKDTEKKRGDRLGTGLVDESHILDPFLEKLAEHVLEPATQDVNGRVVLMGTPGYACRGYWYSVSRNEREKIKRGWKLHHWHTRQNVAMPHIWKNFLAMKARKGWTDDNAIWVREYLGLWVDDPDALFYAFTEAQNVYDQFPGVGGWAYVLGWDLGAGNDDEEEQDGEQHKEKKGNDPMALHVWAFSPKHPNLYEAFSWQDYDAGVEATMEKVDELEKRLGAFFREVADTGGGGKVTVNYVNRRYRRKFKAAEKTGKHDAVRLMNDDLREGRIKGRRDSVWCQQVAALPKDPDDPTKEHPSFANHVCDAALYSWREAAHYWGKTPAKQPKPGTADAANAEAARMEDDEDDDFTRESKREWWEQ